MWLTVDGRAVAPVELAQSRPARRRGLLGRDGLEGALWLQPAGSVHTFRMRFAIDVALCDRDGRVIRTLTLPPGRLTRPRWAVKTVVEAEAGRFACWGVVAGARVAASPDPDPTQTTDHRPPVL